MGPNRRAQEREQAAARAAEEAKRAEAELRLSLMRRRSWLSGTPGKLARALWFYPTIGAAIAAGLPWLTVQRHQTRVTGVLPAMLHLKFPA